MSMSKEKLQDERKKIFEIVYELGAPMMCEGFELKTFCYVLKPLCKALSKNKLLHELYFDEMVPQFHNQIEALKHLWFGVSAIGTINPEKLIPLLHDTTLKIENGEVLYRKLLADVALELGSDVEKSKRFIQFVVSTGELEGVSNARDYMPPQEKRGNDRAFVPYILKIFREADSQAIIAPDDLNALIKWLDDCKLKKLSRKISKFNEKEEFIHDFTGPQEIPQCSDAGSGGTGELSSSEGAVGSASNSRLKRFPSSFEESGDGGNSEFAGIGTGIGKK